MGGCCFCNIADLSRGGGVKGIWCLFVLRGEGGLAKGVRVFRVHDDRGGDMFTGKRCEFELTYLFNCAIHTVKIESG